MRTLGCLVALLVLAGRAFAEPVPLPADRVLLKLSLKLRGAPPSATEQRAFVAAAAPGPEAFAAAYTAKMREYLDSPSFGPVIEAAHAAWWHLPFGPATQLARHVVTLDRNYDEIFDHDYVILDGDSAGFFAQQGIRIDGALPAPTDPARVVRLAAEEARFRSIFSSLDFLNVFPDTPTNRNRKRANQIFRTFLCESLAPSAAIPAHAGLRDGDDDPHANDPDCVGCHYRLDPMARFFDQWRPSLIAGAPTYFDGSYAAAGEVVIPDGAGGAVRTPGHGESELGRILAALPEARRCLARRVWEFAQGTEARLDDATLAELVAAYEAGGRHRLKDVMSAALAHRYFWSEDEPPPINFADVAPIFRSCGCHTKPEQIFDAASYPWRVDLAENAVVVKRIWRAANGLVGSRRMPPAPRPPLAPEALAQIRRWIQIGALDTALNPTLTDAEIDEVLREDRR